jgi:hypothetical protein
VQPATSPFMAPSPSTLPTSFTSYRRFWEAFICHFFDFKCWKCSGISPNRSCTKPCSISSYWHTWNFYFTTISWFSSQSSSEYCQPGWATNCFTWTPNGRQVKHNWTPIGALGKIGMQITNSFSQFIFRRDSYFLLSFFLVLQQIGHEKSICCYLLLIH